MSISNNFYAFNRQVLDLKTGSVSKAEASVADLNQNVTVESSAVKLSEEEFNMNWDQYTGWIYYIQENGVAHAKYINKKGVCTKIMFCSPDRAEQLR